MTAPRQKNTACATRILLLGLVVIPLISSTAETSAATGGTPPEVDCSTLALNMADCLSFLTSGSTVQKPEGSCCPGLKLELKSDADCLCEGFRNAVQLGITLNISRAVSLPAACHVAAPSVSDCGLNFNLGLGPAVSPRASPPKSSRSATSTSEFLVPPPPGSLSSSELPSSIGCFSYVLLFLLVATSFSFL